ncbi:MAG: hypothetical protein FIA96_13650 [Betaproteobacteria bacterium]|nr:hypothetical protein [Betaproteobacteria bacterium]
MHLPGRAAVLVVAMISAACAVQPSSPRVLAYACDDGRGFSLFISSSGDSAEIEIERMRFSLVADPAAGQGEQFSCSMLTLRRRGDTASVDMEGEPQFSNCRVKR